MTLCSESARWQHRAGETITEAWVWVGGSIEQNMRKYGLYVEYYVENDCINAENDCINVESGEIK